MTSQFEQQVRAICGLPLGAVTLLSPVRDGEHPRRRLGEGRTELGRAAGGSPHARLHLYGKRPNRDRGRRVGHFTVTARRCRHALELARKYQARLG